jgi:tetratricopeptide (TPR) repeat protein
MTDVLADILRPVIFLILLSMGALAQSALEQAVTLAREKRYAEARRMLDGVAQPENVKQRVAFHRLKAAIASGLGEAPGAADEMESALKLAPEEQSLLLATAVAELQAGRLDPALQHAAGAGNTAAGQALLGDIQEKRGRFVEAANAYREAVKLAPDREEYRIALALELVEHQTFPPAIAVLEQAAELFPTSAKIRTLLGIAKYAYGDVEGAENALADAIRADPKMEPAYAYLSQIALESSGAPPQSAIDALCGWNRTVCSAMELRVARNKGDTALLSTAIAGLTRAPADDPVSSCELGRAYEWTSQWTEARARMEICVRVKPSPQNHYRLGLIYSQLGLTELAHREMELRKQALQSMSDEDARRRNAVQAFEYAVK